MRCLVTPIPISPSIGRWQPSPSCATHLPAFLSGELFVALKLLAFVREEPLGRALGRSVRRWLDEVAEVAVADGLPPTLDAAGALAPLAHWPLHLQVELLVPEPLRKRVRADGRVPVAYNHGDRSPDLRTVNVPLSPQEYVTVRIAAFGQLSSFKRWAAEVLEDELRRLLHDGRELWRLPPREQVEALLPAERASWDTALAIMAPESRRATRSLPSPRLPQPGAEFLISTD